jgi:hypothetical protein
LEQWDGLFAGVSGHAEVGLCEGNVVGLEAERDLQGPPHASHSDQGCGDEKGADGDLYNEQDIAECEAAKGLRLEGSSLDGLENVGVPYLPGRKEAEEEATDDRQGHGSDINTMVGRDEEVGGKVVEGLPVTQCAQQEQGKEGSNDSAGDGDEDRFGEELTEDMPAARTDCHANGQLTAPIGGAGGEDAGKVNAGGEQDQKERIIISSAPRNRSRCSGFRVSVIGLF